MTMSPTDNVNATMSWKSHSRRAGKEPDLAQDIGNPGLTGTFTPTVTPLLLLMNFCQKLLRRI